MKEFAFACWLETVTTSPETTRDFIWLQEDDRLLSCRGRRENWRRPDQFMGRLYNRNSVRVVPRKVNPRFQSIQGSTEDGISAILSVIEFAIAILSGAVALPPIGACNVMVGIGAALILTRTLSPVPAHFCVCCCVVSRHRHTRTSSSSRRRRRHAPLPHGSGRFTPTKDIIGCTRGRKNRSAMLHGRLIPRARDRVESCKHAWVRSSLFC
jgi:hypothetical protein